MDVNRNNVLTHGEYASTAQPLGFDVSTEAWVELVDRFGDQNRDKSDWRRDPLLDSIDLSLLSGYTSTKIDPLIEELLRRLLRGVMNTFRYNQQLEKRLQVVEQHLDHFVLGAEREKQRKVNLTLRRWKHKWVAFAFDGWKLASAIIRWAELGARYAKAKLLQRRVLTQLLKGILADVFYAWAEAVGHEAARQATLLRKALNWMLRSYLVHSFDAWNVFQAKSQEARAAREEAAAKLARQLVLRWQGSMLHKLFRVWESANRERRALLRRVADAIGPLMTTDDH
ncbi:hypothetical protein Ctob_010466 [Chrysochromulina tobinii]|uniref:Uncharacterized protein n=1 Tax=Chrysochromulina tobinii TaxID=1460289 RepID=A0A0M0J908_9EUKA|nr:hypothetical protein Ctob_010466 [Chrysochromulina tobinii]|eukprot:KOO23069.1 hypothetical protein Ctob_010466 [Chrysochromulina sp. CCMP291]